MAPPKHLAAVEPEKAEKAEVVDEVAVAKGEVVDEAKSAEWHGVTFHLPSQLPAALYFDMTDAEMSDNPSAAGNYAVHAVRQILGLEQWKHARDVAVEKNLPMDAFGDFINAIYKAYGLGSEDPLPSSDSSESDGG